MKDIGIGVVGCGFVGRGAHVPSIPAIEGARLAAVADPDDKRRTKAATKHGAEANYKDYSELVKDPNVDAVIISVPTQMHAQVALAAIEAGKHVLCEMPLANNLEEVDQMIAAATKQGVHLMPGLTFRFTSNYAKAKALIDAGKVGSPTSMLYREFIPAKELAKQWPPDAWVWKLKESGGPLYTLSVWSIDLLRHLTGSEITEVHGAAKYTPLEQFGGTLGYDCSAMLRFANGVVGSLQFSGTVNASAATSTLEVVGDANSTVKAIDNDLVILYEDDPVETKWNVKEHGPRMWGHEQQNAYFVQCLREGNAPSITPEDGRKAMEVAWQIADVG